MWEKWERRYSDHLPQDYETEKNILNHQTTYKSKSKPYQCIKNYKAKFKLSLFDHEELQKAYFKLKVPLKSWGVM